MNQLNIFDEVLHECCSNPITGFFRDGFCNTNEYDQGLHIVCCLIDDNFLKFSFGHFDASKVRKTADYIKETSLYQKLTFLILMYFTHQFLLFCVEAFSFEKLDWIIKKTLISTIISIILCYIFILIFYTKNAR